MKTKRLISMLMIMAVVLSICPVTNKMMHVTASASYGADTITVNIKTANGDIVTSNPIRVVVS